MQCITLEWTPLCSILGYDICAYPTLRYPLVMQFWGEDLCVLHRRYSLVRVSVIGETVHQLQHGRRIKVIKQLLGYISQEWHKYRNMVCQQLIRNPHIDRAHPERKSVNCGMREFHRLLPSGLFPVSGFLKI